MEWLPPREPDRPRGQFSLWGARKGTRLEYGALDFLRAVYLEPLRDPRSGLRAGKSSRVSRLVKLQADEASKNRLVGVVAKAGEIVSRSPILHRASDVLNGRLKGVTGRALAQSVQLRLAEPRFESIANSLQVLLRSRISDAAPCDVDENGLGYNNLLFIAAVLGELEMEHKTEAMDYAALLIEEPEAHLHPQLQAILMEYLGQLSVPDAEAPCVPVAPRGGGSGATDPSPESSLQSVQVIITTHSPVLASKADIVRVRCLSRSPSGDVRASWPGRAVTCKADREYLCRFLDVTKAQLFFAQGLILVEGISEALLLPELARSPGLHVSLEEQAITVVNVQSLAFGRFVDLLGPNGLSIPFAIITDADNESECLHEEWVRPNVFRGTKTLEYDLALPRGNAETMAELYDAQKPRRQPLLAQVQSAPDQADKAELVCERIAGSRRKAEMAQVLAREIALGRPFVVPGYIREAIVHVVRLLHA